MFVGDPQSTGRASLAHVLQQWNQQSFEELDKKLRAAQAREAARKEKKKPSGAGLGFRVATDIVAALVVGVLIGLALDEALGTKPWMMILFFIFGAAAGVLNVYRLMEGYGYAAGYQRQKPEEADRPDNNGEV